MSENPLPPTIWGFVAGSTLLLVIAIESAIRNYPDETRRVARIVLFHISLALLLMRRSFRIVAR